MTTQKNSIDKRSFFKIRKITVVAGFLFSCLLCSCKHYTERYGYLIFTDAEYFKFIPTKGSLNLTTSYSSFFSNNIEEGFGFASTFNNAFYYSVFQHLDTIRIKNKSSNLPERIRTLKILPVRIKFKEISDENSIIYSDTIQIKNHVILYKWNSGNYSIRKITFLNYKHMNRTGPYFEAAPICPLSEDQVIKEKESIKKNIGKTTWRF
jgi:hypothetical protein